MLRIERRTATFADSMKTWSEKEGEDSVTDCDVGVTMELPGGRALANTLIGDTAEHFLWTEENGLLIPRFENLKALALDEKIESAKVEIWPRGLKAEKVTLKDASLTRIRIAPRPSGILKLSFVLHARPEKDGLSLLSDCLGRDIELALFCKEFRAQSKLALEEKPAEAPAAANGKGKRGKPEQRQLDA